MPRVTVGIAATIAFIATVWIANWLVARYGPVPVGFGLEAPAGVYAAGLAFTLRDIVHRALGRGFVIIAVIAGCALAYFIGGDATPPGGLTTIAVASAIAFLVSESIDLAVYESVAWRSFPGAVIFSNITGVVVDSLIFLTMAFGSLTFFNGQVVGKLWMTLVALPLVFAVRWAFPARQG